MKEKKKYRVIKNFNFFVFAFILGLSIYSFNNMKSYEQKFMNQEQSNYVPNKETAIQIAEAIWLPIYGESIYNQKPYIVSLLNDSIWVVEGVLPKNQRGGVAYIEIQKSDCKILKVTHGK